MIFLRTKTSHHGFYEMGCITCYRGENKKKQLYRAILKDSPQFGLVSATRNHKEGIVSNGRIVCYREPALRFCTHRPSRAGSCLGLKYVRINYFLLNNYFPMV